MKQQHASSKLASVPGELQHMPSSSIMLFFSNNPLPHTLHSNAPFRRLSPSADMLLLTRAGATTSILGGGSGEKETTITVRLSQVFRFSASLTNSLEHLSGSLWIISSFLAIVTAPWLLITSQRPSHPIIRNSSSSLNTVSCNSGSALSGQDEPTGPFMCQSPIARATDNCPFRYPSYTAPPSFSIRFLSDVLLGLWSFDSSIALPRFPSTARQSPAFATTNVLQVQRQPPCQKSSRNKLAIIIQ